jgi:hypothetical protein
LFIFFSNFIAWCCFCFKKIGFIVSFNFFSIELSWSNDLNHEFDKLTQVDSLFITQVICLSYYLKLNQVGYFFFFFFLFQFHPSKVFFFSNCHNCFFKKKYVYYCFLFLSSN